MEHIQKPDLSLVLEAMEAHWRDYGSEPRTVDIEGREYVVEPKVFNSAGSNSALNFLHGMEIPEGGEVLQHLLASNGLAIHGVLNRRVIEAVGAVFELLSIGRVDELGS